MIQICVQESGIGFQPVKMGLAAGHDRLEAYPTLSHGYDDRLPAYPTLEELHE